MEKGKKKKDAGASKTTKSKAPAEDKTKYAKRPVSAFFIYSQSLRDEIKRNGGSISGVENLAKMAGRRWGELSEADRKPFNDKAAKDKERYERELASGLKAPPRKTKNAKAGKKQKVKDPNRPKRPNTAYLYYSADFRKSKHAVGLKHTEIMKVAAEKWKALSESDKKIYVEMENKDKARFQKEMAEYTKNNPSSAKSSKVSKVATKAKAPLPSDSLSESAEEDDVDDDSNLEDDEDE